MSCESWRAIEFGPHSFGIERIHDKALVGSIDLNDGRWHVEIVRPDGDDTIRAEFVEYVCALAFVKGVEAVIARMAS